MSVMFFNEYHWEHKSVFNNNQNRCLKKHLLVGNVRSNSGTAFLGFISTMSRTPGINCDVGKWKGRMCGKTLHYFYCLNQIKPVLSTTLKARNDLISPLQFSPIFFGLSLCTHNPHPYSPNPRQHFSFFLFFFLLVCDLFITTRFIFLSGQCCIFFFSYFTLE